MGVAALVDTISSPQARYLGRLGSLAERPPIWHGPRGKPVYLLTLARFDPSSTLARARCECRLRINEIMYAAEEVR
jgi:hypothetical protein